MVSDLIAERKGHRLVSRQDGIWPEGARGEVDHRRREERKDAGDHESKDQVPRELQALCPFRTRREVSLIISSSKGKSPYMLLVAPVKEELRKPMTKEEEALFGIEKAEYRPLGYPGGNAR